MSSSSLATSAVEIVYGAGLLFILGVMFVVLSSIEPTLAGLAGLLILVAIGPNVGIATTRFSLPASWGGVLAFGAVAVAVPAVGALVMALPVAVTVAEAVVVAYIGAIAGAVAVAAAAAFAGAVLGAVAVAAAGVFTATVAAAGSVAIGAATARRRHRGAYAGAVGSATGWGVVLALYGFRGAAGDGPITLLIFFLMLPVVNGFWDWLSWWITRALGRHLLVTLEPAHGIARRSLTILGYGALDLVIAVLLLAAMAFLLAFGFEGYNQIAEAQGRSAFELEPYLESAADHPWTNGLWLTVMLLSTLFPTALHVVALLASPIALITLPTDKRLALAGDLDNYRAQPSRQAGIQRRAGQWVARERHGAIAIASGLFVLLVGGLSMLVNFGLGMLDPDQSVARLVLWVAERGIDMARALADAMSL